MGWVVDSVVMVSPEKKYDHSFLVKFTAPKGEFWKTQEVQVWANRKDAHEAVHKFIEKTYPKAIVYSVKYV